MKLTFDALESRRMLSVTVGLPDGADTTVNGSATIVGSRVRLTDNFNQAGSVWSETRIPLARFRAHFTYRVNAGNTADGFCFVVHDGTTADTGGIGVDLGYAGIGDSEAACFNFYNFAAFDSKFGFASDGQVPPTTDDMSPLDFHAGGAFKGTVRYDGSEMRVFMRRVGSGQIFSASKTIDLAAAIGDDTAIVGFTGSTGVVRSVQWIESAGITANAEAPTVATAAQASPNPSLAKSTLVSALGSDAAGEANLTYTWSVGKIPGGAITGFSPNGTNDAKNSTMTFSKVGVYRVLCTITNPDGESVVTSLLLNVGAQFTSIRMRPHAQTIERGTSVNYYAAAHDQFGKGAASPSPVFAIVEGPGSIDPSTGIYTADGGRGHLIISATIGDLIGRVGATVR